jgi:hypothetical protein
LLPVIAEYADIETITILSSSHPLKLSLDLGHESLTSSRLTLEQRRDYSEKLSLAFEELTIIAQAEESMAGSLNSLQESGLYFSARSSFHSDLAEVIAQLDSATISSCEGSEGEVSDRYDSPVEKQPPRDVRESDQKIDRVQW